MPSVSAPSALPAHQARSRESLRKLLGAAREVLARYGTDGATISRIARHAGLTPGSVYRRFENKEALLEAAILEILERQEDTLTTSLTPLATSRIPMPVFAGKVIGGMVGAYRENAGVLRAIRQFVQERLDSAFGRKASALQAVQFQRTVDLFLLFRQEIRHPQPVMAVSLAVKMIAGTLYQVVVWPMPSKAAKDSMPEDDAALARELTRAFLTYLGVATSYSGVAT